MKFLVLTFSILAIIAAGILLSVALVVFPHIPAPSADYDCDDAALDTYLHFLKMGIEPAIICGDLDRDGEAYQDSDHVWIIASLAGFDVAWDWGKPRFDGQHYEGYPLTLDELLAAVEGDHD